MALTPYNPEMKLSTKYTLRDLTITNQPFPNMPANDQELANLKWLARTLEDLEREIGPFKIISAFRSPEVNAAVKGLGADATTTTTTRSFHEAGMAVDIYPTTMTINEFFGKIIAGPWKQKLGEIALKPTQNAIHVSLPTEKYQGVVMVMDSAGKYIRQTAQWIEDFSKPYVTAISEAAQAAYETVDSSVWDTQEDGSRKIKTWVWVSGAVFSLGLLLLIMKPRRT